MIASTKRRKAQALKARLNLMNGRLEREPQKWVIVKWIIDHHLRCHFVMKEYATRIGGFSWTPNVTAAESWRSYAAAKKYQRSKTELAGCEILNFTRLEKLVKEQEDATNAEMDRRHKTAETKDARPWWQNTKARS